MSNIYLNEFDRFAVHGLKPLAYMRYGDDWLCLLPSKAVAEEFRVNAIEKLAELSLTVNPKIDTTRPVVNGVSYLGVDIWPNGRRLRLDVQDRVKERLNTRNVASYRALVSVHEKQKKLKMLDWWVLMSAGVE